MILSKDAAILSQQDLPADIRPRRGPHPRDARTGAFVSGIIAGQQPDGVICPLMLQRHLVAAATPCAPPSAVSRQ